MGWVLLAVLAALAGFVVVLYNRLVKSKQMVEEGWSGISVQLKRRSDLIPNLLAAVKGYMAHEKGVLERVTEMRAKAQAAEGSDPADRAKAEGALSGVIPGSSLANANAAIAPAINPDITQFGHLPNSRFEPARLEAFEACCCILPNASSLPSGDSRCFRTASISFVAVDILSTCPLTIANGLPW
jgi:hypothetical protein